MAFGFIGDAFDWTKGALSTAGKGIGKAYDSKAGWILPGGALYKVAKYGAGHDELGPTPYDEPLPYGGELNAGLGDLEKLIAETRSSTARPEDLTGARNYARQAAASRGLEGPLAATQETFAQDQVNSAHAARRNQILQQLLGSKFDILGSLRGEELAMRDRNFQLQQLRKAMQGARLKKLLSLAGGGIGGYFGGPGGVGLGSEAGGLGADIFSSDV